MNIPHKVNFAKIFTHENSLVYIILTKFSKDTVAFVQAILVCALYMQQKVLVKPSAKRTVWCINVG